VPDRDIPELSPLTAPRVEAGQIAPAARLPISAPPDPRLVKRLFDVTAATGYLLLLSPLLLAVAAAVKFTSPGPVFFRQERMGLNFKPFRIFKFRTMVADAPGKGGQITAGADARITPVGRVLRKAKLDELPQLLNILLGDMSLVGPRPEVRRYVEMFPDDFAVLLSVRPGITDLASVEFRDEQAILGAAADPEVEYVNRVLPAKIALSKQYVERMSLWYDLNLIVRTLGKLFR
jgi:lipopolysaccharide/colanic/teichoic acid biosynthesis glycosyltransferase